MPHINLEASVQSNYVSSVTERYLFLHETVTKPNYITSSSISYIQHTGSSVLSMLWASQGEPALDFHKEAACSQTLNAPLGACLAHSWMNHASLTSAVLSCFSEYNHEEAMETVKGNKIVIMALFIYLITNYLILYTEHRKDTINPQTSNYT